MANLANCIAMMDDGVGRVGQVIPQLPAAQARLCRLMLMLGNTIERELELNLKPHKLNHSEFLTLMILYSGPAGSSAPCLPVSATPTGANSSHCCASLPATSNS